MPTDLWKQLSYKTPAKYLVNTFIREVDLSKANINSLLYCNRISQEEYQTFLNMDKQEREVKIGLWIRRDKSVYKDIQRGIIEAKRRLCYANGIEDFDVVAVKNDAMFIVGKAVNQLVFPPFEFKIKNVYNVYLQLADLEIYYGDTVDPYTGSIQTSIDVKGVPDKTLALHQGGMLDLICDVCYKIQREDIRDTVSWFSEVYKAFIERKLDKQYYRNLDSFSGFVFNSRFNSFSLGEISDDMVKCVDINRNLLILRGIMSILADIYSRSIR